MLINVIPIWTVESNLFGALTKSSAILALCWPFFAAVSRRLLRAEINAISDIEKHTVEQDQKKMINISKGGGGGGGGGGLLI